MRDFAGNETRIKQEAHQTTAMELQNLPMQDRVMRLTSTEHKESKKDVKKNKQTFALSGAAFGAPQTAIGQTGTH